MRGILLPLLIYFIKETGSCASTSAASPAVTSSTSTTSTSTTTTTSTTSTTTTTTSLTCPTDYTLMANHCYSTLIAAADAQAAQATCMGMGSYLAVAHSAAENLILMMLSNGMTIWLGYLKLPPATDFQSADGGAFDYNNWDTAAGEPTGGFLDNCITMDGATGLWSDGPCLGVTNPFICMQAPTVVT